MLVLPVVSMLNPGIHKSRDDRLTKIKWLNRIKYIYIYVLAVHKKKRKIFNNKVATCNDAVNKMICNKVHRHMIRSHVAHWN